MVLGALAVVVLIGALAYWKWQSRPYTVEVATALAPSAAQGPAAILQASGYVTARREATVSAQITGTIKEVLIEEGEHVKAGQVLARLDDSAYQAGVAQARAQLLAAQALEVAVHHAAGAGAARHATQPGPDRQKSGIAPVARDRADAAGHAERAAAGAAQADRGGAGARCAARRCSLITAPCGRRLTG